MSNATQKTTLTAMMVGAIGVVFGDIGTSVLYTMKTILDMGFAHYNQDGIYSILSLLFWTLTLVVSVKYVSILMRADNKGEGGIIALLVMATQSARDNPKRQHWLLLLGVFGTGLFYGDGVITPAITTLGAMEGLNVISTGFADYVAPATLGILLGLFLIQRHGTAGIGKLFGPVMLLWFVAIGLMGLYHVWQTPSIFAAINPYYAIRFIHQDPPLAFVLLGAVVLCVTGAEALYADMGHFGKKPIQLAWFFIVMPCLLLNYFGQGALLLSNPAARANPFFMMLPESWGHAPMYFMVALATAAAVIASQALLTGAFSITKQVIQLGFFPRMRVLYTNVHELGQIYMPFVNWALFIAIVLAVMIFQSSDRLAAAYGIAVTMVMLITTVLSYFVIRHAWKVPMLPTFLITGFFFWMDFAFWSSNLLKFFHGGWFPIAIGAFVFLIMVTWKRGTELLVDLRQQQAIPLDAFLDNVFTSPPTRVEGTAVFLCPTEDATPSAFLHNLKHNKVLHEVNLFVTVRNHESPWVGLSKRMQIESLGHNCWKIVLNYGFKNEINVPDALAQIKGHGFDYDAMQTSYFLSREVVIPAAKPGMMQWREKLFAHMHHNASAAAEFLHLPSNAVVELGAKVEI